MSLNDCARWRPKVCWDADAPHVLIDDFEEAIAARLCNDGRGSEVDNAGPDWSLRWPDGVAKNAAKIICPSEGVEIGSD